MATARQLANAVETRCQTASGFLTYRGLVTSKPAKGYVSLYFSGGRPYADRLFDTATALTWSFRAVCVGYTDDQCMYVLEKLRGLFQNWRPFPDDRDTGWFTEAPDDPPLLKDDSLSDDVRFSITPRFTITTRST